MLVQRSYVEIGPRGLSCRHGDYLGDESSPTRRRLEREVVEPAAQKFFFEKLRTTRRELAKAAGVPPYIIATDRTLWDMVDFEPCDPSGLKLVHGMGDNKIRRFGDDFLIRLTASTRLNHPERY